MTKPKDECEHHFVLCCPICNEVRQDYISIAKIVEIIAGFDWGCGEDHGERFLRTIREAKKG